MSLLSNLAENVRLLSKKSEPAQEAPKKVPSEPQDALLDINDPRARAMLYDAFNSQYWPYIKDYILHTIVQYEVAVSRSLETALADPKDTVGRVSSYHGGRLRGGEEIRNLVSKLKKRFVDGDHGKNRTHMGGNDGPR